MSLWVFLFLLRSNCLADEMLKVYNKVSIRWTTHQPKGLTNLDVVMAQLCDSYV